MNSAFYEFIKGNMKSINTDSDPQGSGRTLIYFPIIHTQADMGALGEAVKHATLGKLGRHSMKRKMNMIDRAWTEIETAIDKLDIAYENVRIYQDGLPVCGKEIEVVTELAKAESRNHQLLLRLMQKGAKLMGTESSELLIKEYELSKQMLDAGNIPAQSIRTARQKREADLVLGKRDQFIAGRINKTLQKGETGILFLGALHSLQPRLDEDIRVLYPVSRPRTHRGK